MTIATVRARRAAALDSLNVERKSTFDAFKAIAAKKGFDKDSDQPEYDRLKKAVDDLDLKIKATGEEYDAEIKRLEEAQDRDRDTARPVPGQDGTVAASVEDDAYISKSAAEAQGLTTNKGLIAVAMAKAMHMGGYVPSLGIEMAKHNYGERHPATVALQRGFAVGTRKALAAGLGSSGGFIVPPDYVNEIIELLRPRVVVRAANPRSMPMPRGTMTLPAQTAAATASYGSESAQIAASQQTLGQIVATYKKLTALVPVTNDLMRYASPAADAFVRDDLVKVIALREDLAFLTGDGTQDTPMGFLGFANKYVSSQGGTIGIWKNSADSTYASGGQFISSNESYSLTTVANELSGLVNKLDAANVPDIKRRWFFNPRIFNYLNNLLNSLGVYVYRDELSRGTLLGYPYSTSTQIPVNLYDTSGSQTNCTFIFLVEMDDAMILDSMQLELAVSREGTYYDSNNNLQSAFQKDQTLIRAIEEHDFQMRHLPSVAVNQGVIWSPAIS